MNDKELATLRKSHEEFIADAKKRGDNVLFFTTPCCDKEQEVLAPPKDSRAVWDGLTTCSHCGRQFFKIVDRNTVIVHDPLPVPGVRRRSRRIPR